MPINIQQALQHGVTAHNQGNLKEAERVYRAILQSQPNQPDASHNLGLIAIDMGRIDIALPLFKSALDEKPIIEQFWISYITALLKDNQSKKARQVIKKAKKKGIDGNHFRSLFLSSTKKIAKKEPSQGAVKRLMAAFQSKRFIEAEALAFNLTKEFPKYQFAWKILGEVFKQTKRMPDAFSACEKAVQLNDLDAEAHCNLGACLVALGRLQEAEACYLSAIALKPDFAGAHYNFGILLQKSARLQLAELSYRRSIELYPDNSLAYNNLAITLQDLGRVGEAQEAFAQAIAIQPNYAEAHRHLATIKIFKTKDNQYKKMMDLYLDDKIKDDQLCHINFGLAKACEDLGDFENAFKHYRAGNALRKKRLCYDINKDVNLFNKVKSSFPQITKFSLKDDDILKKCIPIFILGMPRSGTTLVEQIISSHPLIMGAGELSFISEFGSEISTGIENPSNKSLMAFRELYLKKLDDIGKGSFAISDKMPQNFLFIGLIVAAFPEAKIVHVKRNPEAVCWANYSHYFPSDGFGYCYDLNDTKCYYGLYQNLMEFWDAAVGERIYHLDYERLTLDQKGVTKELIEYLGLEWDGRLLTPEKNTRDVLTASNWQVRKKVYQGSSKNWKRYEPFLDGIFNNL